VGWRLDRGSGCEAPRLGDGLNLPQRQSAVNKKIAPQAKFLRGRNRVAEKLLCGGGVNERPTRDNRLVVQGRLIVRCQVVNAWFRALVHDPQQADAAL
jgi:hypothetical protein